MKALLLALSACLIAGCDVQECASARGEMNAFEQCKANTGCVTTLADYRRYESWKQEYREFRCEQYEQPKTESQQ